MGAASSMDGARWSDPRSLHSWGGLEGAGAGLLGGRHCQLASCLRFCTLVPCR